MAEGCSLSWLMADAPGGATQVLGLLAFGDKPKAQAAEAVRQLHALGLRTVLISGDNRGAAEAVARQVGIDEVHAEVLPGDKAAVVAALRDGLPTARAWPWSATASTTRRHWPRPMSAWP